MIKWKVQNEYEVEQEDYLGGDPVIRGEYRKITVPVVVVVYYDDDTEEILGHTEFKMASRSAFETMEAVENYANKEVERFKERQGKIQVIAAMPTKEELVNKYENQTPTRDLLINVVKAGLAESVTVPRIIVPYVGEVNPKTKEALKNYAVEYIDVSGKFGYYELLKSLWEKPEDVIIVEHDVIPWDGALEYISSCKEEWCGYAYDENSTSVSFGCTKLTKKHMEKIPTLWNDIEFRHWGMLDAWHGDNYLKLDVKPHNHAPHVINYNLNNGLLTSLEADQKIKNGELTEEDLAR